MRKIITGVLLMAALSGTGQTVLKKANWECQISPDGFIEQLVFKGKSGNDTIPFFQKKEKAGPCFYAKTGDKEVKAQWVRSGTFCFGATIDGVECVLRYLEHRSCPAIEVTLTNRGVVPFQPGKAGLKLGIDTYMDKYPDWFGKYFPTLMRCEDTHFYGYFQNPEEHSLAIVSEQPVASWSVDYNMGYQSISSHWFMGHRIESFNLDLLNALPLPDRHPQHLYELRQGESKSWLITFVNTGKLERLEQSVTEVADIPMICAERTSYRPGEKAEFDVWGKNPVVRVKDDKGNELTCEMKASAGGKSRRVNVVLPEIGLYTVVVNSDNKQAEAVLTVPQTWAWTMDKARANALRYHQKASSHVESWYGFYSAFIAAKYFPDKKIDKTLSDRFERVFSQLHDVEKMEPKYHRNRIQNTSGTIGILVDKYEAEKNIKDLEDACRLADWLITISQRKDGAYYNNRTVYTSVIYVAKSVLELALAEKELGRTDPQWQKAYERHYESAKRAIDQLVASQGDFQTEGEMTFEDGMISCSALQIGMFALLQEDVVERQRYTDAMMKILNSHSCLTQLRVPDGRRRQGTMRYWEAQYDVQMLPNMFNSPHGWSGWRAYATYYAYLLTGEEKWLEQTFNAMGAFANLIDYQNGNLRWAFVVDPHLEVEQACSPDLKVGFDSVSFGNPHPRLYDTRKFVIGEQYVNMISDWQPINTQDNDVHEVFKCIGETVLDNAFILERGDGTVIGYNCSVKQEKGRLTVKGVEKQITHLHCNLKQPYDVEFNGKKHRMNAGMGWINR